MELEVPLMTYVNVIHDTSENDPMLFERANTRTVMQVARQVARNLNGKICDRKLLVVVDAGGRLGRADSGCKLRHSETV